MKHLVMFKTGMKFEVEADGIEYDEDDNSYSFYVEDEEGEDHYAAIVMLDDLLYVKVVDED